VETALNNRDNFWLVSTKKEPDKNVLMPPASIKTTSTNGTTENQVAVITSEARNIEETINHSSKCIGKKVAGKKSAKK